MPGGDNSAGPLGVPAAGNLAGESAAFGKGSNASVQPSHAPLPPTAPAPPPAPAPPGFHYVLERIDLSSSAPPLRNSDGVWRQLVLPAF